MTKYLCNLLIPGAPKSGTTSLHAMLEQHPRVSMSSPKEPQFFSFDDRYKHGAELHNRIFADTDAAKKYYCESSQCYFTHDWAVRRISQDLREPKAILVLRDPVERAISQYNWNYRRGWEREGLLEALQTRGDERGYFYIPDRRQFDAVGGYLRFSRYSRWVPLWERILGKESVLVLRFENLFSDPQKTANRVFKFLGIDQVPIESKTKNVTSQTLNKHAPSWLKPLLALVPNRLKRSEFYGQVRYAGRKLQTKSPPKVSAASMDYLRSELASEIDYFDGILGSIDNDAN